MEGANEALKKLLEAQKDIRVSKSRFNKFGGFSYWSKEDILEAAKPVCHERGLLLTMDDSIEVKADGWVYARADVIVTDTDTGASVTCHG